MNDQVAYGPWLVLASLGKGGQGEVFRVLDTRKVSVEDAAFQLSRACFEIRQGNSAATIKSWSPQISSALSALASADDPRNMGALKVLAPTAGRADHQNAYGRFLNELKAYSSTTHPNLLRLLDSNEEDHWCVTEYHPARELTGHQELFAGHAEKALTAFRGLVSGVTALHERDIIHRDIKPANIFIDHAGRLVLGDAGLAFYLEQNLSRLTETLESVGSHDWMAPWLMSGRSAISVSADLFSLGKVLWWMVSGLARLLLWYHRDEAYNVETLFPGDESMQVVNHLLDDIVVEREAQMRVSSASGLLKKVDEALQAVRGGYQVVTDDKKRRCHVCGKGLYVFVDTRFVVFTDHGDTRVYLCNFCGHIQVFRVGPQLPPAWKTGKG